MSGTVLSQSQAKLYQDNNHELNNKGDSNLNQINEILQVRRESLCEGARTTRPPLSYLTLTHMKMIKSPSHSHSQNLDLVFSFALP